MAATGEKRKSDAGPLVLTEIADDAPATSVKRLKNDDGSTRAVHSEKTLSVPLPKPFSAGLSPVYKPRTRREQWFDQTFAQHRIRPFDGIIEIRRVLFDYCVPSLGEIEDTYGLDSLSYRNTDIVVTRDDLWVDYQRFDTFEEKLTVADRDLAPPAVTAARIHWWASCVATDCTALLPMSRYMRGNVPLWNVGLIDHTDHHPHICVLVEHYDEGARQDTVVIPYPESRRVVHYFSGRLFAIHTSGDKHASVSLPDGVVAICRPEEHVVVVVAYAPAPSGEGNGLFQINLDSVSMRKLVPIAGRVPEDSVPEAKIKNFIPFRGAVIALTMSDGVFLLTFHETRYRSRRLPFTLEPLSRQLHYTNLKWSFRQAFVHRQWLFLVTGSDPEHVPNHKSDYISQISIRGLDSLRLCMINNDEEAIPKAPEPLASSPVV